MKERTRETNNKAGVETTEHFRISQVHFEFVRTKRQRSYFTNASDHFLKLQDGMRLRIAYVEASGINKIVKLELVR